MKSHGCTKPSPYEIAFPYGIPYEIARGGKHAIYIQRKTRTYVQRTTRTYFGRRTQTSERWRGAYRPMPRMGTLKRALWDSPREFLNARFLTSPCAQQDNDCVKTLCTYIRCVQGGDCGQERGQDGRGMRRERKRGHISKGKRDVAKVKF